MKQMSFLQELPTPQCLVCSSQYISDDLQLLDDRERGRVYHGTCSSCGVSAFLFENRNQGISLFVGVLTDVTSREDLTTLFQRQVISQKDVINAFEFFQKEDISVRGRL